MILPTGIKHEYKVVHGYEPSDLADAVEKLLSAGWTCQGSVSVACPPGEGGYYNYFQAMVKSTPVFNVPELNVNKPA